MGSKSSRPLASSLRAKKFATINSSYCLATDSIRAVYASELLPKLQAAGRLNGVNSDYTAFGSKASNKNRHTRRTMKELKRKRGAVLLSFCQDTGVAVDEWKAT